MNPPNFDTLVSDIYSFIRGQGKFDEIKDEDFKDLSEQIATVCNSRFKERRDQQNKPPVFSLRMSNYGLPLRKLWYESRFPSHDKYKAEDLLKFLMGDICEAVLLFLAKKTGHDVQQQQATITVDGVDGHIDAVIDGVLVDVKSASKWAFKSKFVDGELLNGNDDFGYIPQIKAYQKGTGALRAAFLAQNKETGELATLTIPNSIKFDVSGKIAEAQSVIAIDVMPTRCYSDEPEGEYGNRVISKSCGYCRFKKDCWKDSNYGYGLRAFKYSNGIKYFTHVAKTPRVDEVRVYDHEDDEE